MNITDQAAIELKKSLAEFDKPTAGIHLFSTAGCCGPSIQMDIAPHIGNEETIISIQDIEFYVANDLISQLADVTIEYGSNGFKLAGLQKSSSCCE
ncbi:MAG: hypothetical protein JJE49_02275 [Peptostreptococcaceae bacterium]|nr:hypothetical protein [Peptostreptococcaceae bacterium]